MKNTAHKEKRKKIATIRERNQHYFIDWRDVACVACGLNWRYLREEPFCKENTKRFRRDKKFISGRRILDNDSALINPNILAITQNCQYPTLRKYWGTDKGITHSRSCPKFTKNYAKKSISKKDLSR